MIALLSMVLREISHFGISRSIVNYFGIRMCVSVRAKCRRVINSLIPNYIHRKLAQSVEAILVIIIELFKNVRKHILTKSFGNIYI